MKSLVAKGQVIKIEQPCLADAVASAEAGPKLNSEQQLIIDTIQSQAAGYKAHLIHGITGSGKTEVRSRLASC